MFTEKVLLCIGVTVDKCMHKQTELSSFSDKIYIRAIWNPQLGGPTINCTCIYFLCCEFQVDDFIFASLHGTLNYTSAVYPLDFFTY